MLEIQLKPMIRQASFTVPGLKVGQYVTFSAAWPTELGITPGRTYQVMMEQMVRAPREFIVPAMGSNNDYVEVNLSNESGGQLLYPTSGGFLHEIFIAFKPYAGFAQMFSPSDQILMRMPSTAEVYTIGTARLRVLGAIFPEQSTEDDPRIRLMAVYRMVSVFIRLHVLGTPSTPTTAAFDKSVIVFMVNRLALRPIANPTPEQLPPPQGRGLYIPYLDEVTFRMSPASLGVAA